MPVSFAAARDNKTKQAERGDRHDDFAGELRVAGECNNGSHYGARRSSSAAPFAALLSLSLSLPPNFDCALSLYLGPLVQGCKY